MPSGSRPGRDWSPGDRRKPGRSRSLRRSRPPRRRPPRADFTPALERRTVDRQSRRNFESQAEISQWVPKYYTQTSPNAVNFFEIQPISNQNSFLQKNKKQNQQKTKY